MFLSHSTGTPILTADDATVLVWLGLATQPDEYGNRQLHKRLIQTQSSHGFNRYSNGHCFETNPDAFVTIPDRILSEATIYYLGFTAEKTAQIWRSWLDMYMDFTELPEYATRYPDGISVSGKVFGTF
ncbi:hypothetical protein FSPOR_6207 [Fusarium sporotrichioides]|uniref:Uncharacterized protein n=1 Tax=Fusarium sporotrichioides TaxID=5514 RepID=A0A395S445_FUSSP|nr:hypothetical protein FSPOR_6207 [Fusarium sporotrichioides]